MLARAMESYVFDKLAAEGNKSQYLVQGVEPNRFGEGYKANPYPSGAERDTINGVGTNVSATRASLNKENPNREPSKWPICSREHSPTGIRPSPNATRHSPSAWCACSNVTSPASASWKCTS